MEKACYMQNVEASLPSEAAVIHWWGGCVQLEDEGGQMISEVTLQHEATSSSSRAATPARSASSGHCANHFALVISGDAQDSPLSY